MSLQIIPIDFAAACAFVDANHRHHKAPRGHKFSIAVSQNGKIVGVANVGRPVSRKRQDGFTLEANRICSDGTSNVISKLTGAMRRVAKNLGYRTLITYILKSENGHSLIAAGWNYIGESRGGSWNSPSRPRTDKAPTEAKKIYGIKL